MDTNYDLECHWTTVAHNMRLPASVTHLQRAGNSGARLRACDLDEVQPTGEFGPGSG